MLWSGVVLRPGAEGAALHSRGRLLLLDRVRLLLLLLHLLHLLLLHHLLLHLHLLLLLLLD